MTMGDLIDLQLRRTRRAQAACAEPVYYFDVTDPMSYLAAERVERSLGQIEWVAIDGSSLRSDAPDVVEDELVRASAELHARALRLPLIWPEPFTDGGTRARRAASFA
ncbi:MAG: hypothetical protein WAL22_18700, partial [Solirubrobacteraceae bacterium]